MGLDLLAEVSSYAWLWLVLSRNTVRVGTSRGLIYINDKKKRFVSIIEMHWFVSKWIYSNMSAILMQNIKKVII